MSESTKNSDATPEPARKPYSPPRLVDYGHVKDIIQGGPGMGSDAPQHSKLCWIAEALYGAADPRTQLLRAWLTVIYDERRPGWMFVALYRTFGRSTAALITRGLLPRRVLQGLFDVLVKKALTDSAVAFVAVRH
jgi:hypothetical protein